MPNKLLAQWHGPKDSVVREGRQALPTTSRLSRQLMVWTENKTFRTNSYLLAREEFYYSHEGFYFQSGQFKTLWTVR